jgi:hypothetical protein
VDELCSQEGATWRLLLTGDQRNSRQAERVIGLLKLYLAQLLEGKRCFMMEIVTLLDEAA